MQHDIARGPRPKLLTVEADAIILVNLRRLIGYYVVINPYSTSGYQGLRLCSVKLGAFAQELIKAHVSSQ